MQLRKLKGISLMLTLALCMSGCGSNDASGQSQTTPVPVAEETPDNPIPPADSFAGGDGTESNPYQIATAEQLSYLADLINNFSSNNYTEEVSYRTGYYVLTADIELNDISDFASWETKAPAHEWEPIGASSGDAFEGHFDGDGHVIKGMYIDNNYTFSNSNQGGKGTCVGLFGYLNDAVVSDVTLEDSLILANSHVTYAGSIAGRAMASEVRECTSAADMKVAMADHLGGILGYSINTESKDKVLEMCTIYGNTFTGEINFTNALPEKTAYIGGVIGYAMGNVANCTNRGSILVQGETNDYIGGIAGEFKGGNSALTDCVNESAITLSGNPYLGGICGHILAGSATTSSTGENDITCVLNCENKGNITLTENSNSVPATVGGVAGNIGDFGGSYLQIDLCKNSGTVSGLGHVGGVIGESTVVAIPWAVANCENSGAVTGDSFTGGILGYVGSTKEASGIEACVNNGAVTGSSSTGGILGGYFSYNVTDAAKRAPFTISDCKNTGAVSLNTNSIVGIGGIAGSLQLDQPTDIFHIKNCTNAGTIGGAEALRAGGILGGLSVTSAGPGGFCSITDCNNTGDLIQGNGKVTVTSSMSDDSAAVAGGTDDKTALIMGGSSIGGIAGYFKQGTMENCTASGNFLIGDNAKPIFDYADLSVSLQDDKENALVFVGGVCGLYYYEDGGDGYSPDTCYIRNCKYSSAVPTGVVFALPGAAAEATVSNVTATK